MHEQVKEDWPAAIELAEAALVNEPAIREWAFGSYIIRAEIAQILALVGDHDRAVDGARDVLAFASRHDNGCLELMGHLVLGWVELERGNVTAADELIRSGFGKARSLGYVNLPCSPSADLARLAARALAVDIEPAWLPQLIRDRQVPAPAPCRQRPALGCPGSGPGHECARARPGSPRIPWTGPRDGQHRRGSDLSPACRRCVAVPVGASALAA